MGSTQTIRLAPGDIPKDMKSPLAFGIPDYVASVPWTSNKPMRMDFEIRGLTTFGNYTPPSIAVVERYDPFKRTIVASTRLIFALQARSIRARISNPP